MRSVAPLACAFTELYLLKQHVSSFNIFIWGVVLCCHAACKNFAGLFVVRLLLGISEGSLMTGFLIITSMFYTLRENTTRVGYCCENCDQPAFYSLFHPLTVLMNGTGLRA